MWYLYRDQTGSDYEVFMKEYMVSDYAIFIKRSVGFDYDVFTNKNYIIVA